MNAGRFNLIGKFTCSIFLGFYCWSVAFAQAANYLEEEVRFQSGGVELAGTVFLPEGKGPHPAIIVTHGSGREGRKLRGYRGLAALLANEGYVTLLYDKRGIGDSKGEYVETPDLRIPAGDILAGVKLLKERKNVDPARIGVFGHSQGGWVGPLAASMSQDIAFLISLCGPGVSIREQVLYHRSEDLKAEGHSDETIKTIIGFARKLNTYLGTGAGYETLKPEYERAVTQPWFAYFRKQGYPEILPEPKQLDHPRLTVFRHQSYDPFPVLKQIRIPTLALFGAKDKQVPTEESVRLWKLAFEKSGNQNRLTLVVLPEEGHPIWDMSSGTPLLRSAFREPLVDWLRKQKTRRRQES